MIRWPAGVPLPRVPGLLVPARSMRFRLWIGPSLWFSASTYCATESLMSGARMLLECLARDTAVRVRAILAEEIKALDCIPRDVALVLARDLEAPGGSPSRMVATDPTGRVRVELVGGTGVPG